MNEWISVKERLPEIERLVLIRTFEPNIRLARLGGSVFWEHAHASCASYHISEVTHWHLLPAPPSAS